MRYGMNLLLWTASVGPDHYPLLHCLRQQGFDGVEVPVGAGDVPDYAALAGELDQLGFARTAVTSLDPRTNPVDPDPAVRKAAVERLRWALDCAAAMSCDTLCGPYHSAYKVFSGAPPTDDERARCAEVLHAAAEYAETLGIRMALEFLNRFECYLLTTAADTRDLIERVGHPSLTMLYDTHHAHIEEKDPAAAITASADVLGHIHASESDRGTPGSGQVRWEETLRALLATGYDGWLTIEAFSRTDPDFASAIHVWRNFEPDPLQLTAEGLRFLRDSVARASS